MQNATFIVSGLLQRFQADSFGAKSGFVYFFGEGGREIKGKITQRIANSPSPRKEEARTVSIRRPRVADSETEKRRSERSLSASARA